MTQNESEWVLYMTRDVRRNGHTLREVMAYDDFDWDREHFFIQWLFPNKIASSVNLDAPVLLPQDIIHFHENEHLRASCKVAILRFMQFLGIAYSDGAFRRAHNFRHNSRFWLCQYNHNHLRITRVIKFSMALGRQELCEKLLQFLISECALLNHPPRNAIKYWEQSVYGITDEGDA